MDSVGEWSHEFDLLYDNITSGKAPGLVPFEKSVFLTHGEENVAVGLYNGTISVPFESTEEVTSYLATLVDQATGIEKGSSDSGYKVLSDQSKVYALDGKDILFITLEECKIKTQSGDRIVPVNPVPQDEYFRTIRNPFKGANGNRVLRLAYSTIGESAGTFTETRYAELFSPCEIEEYKVRYIKRPEPIILETLTGGLTINGKTEAATCKLPKAIHGLILAEAVRLAKAVWNS